MDSGQEEAPPIAPTVSFNGDGTKIGVAADLDTQTGLKSPSGKRAKLSESHDNHLPSLSKECATEDEDGEECSSEEGSQSPDSFVLDLFHAEASGESLSGIFSLPNGLMEMISRLQRKKVRL